VSARKKVDADTVGQRDVRHHKFGATIAQRKYLEKIRGGKNVLDVVGG